jgi:hypothetical protein
MVMAAALRLKEVEAICLGAIGALGLGIEAPQIAPRRSEAAIVCAAQKHRGMHNGPPP